MVDGSTEKPRLLRAASHPICRQLFLRDSPDLSSEERHLRAQGCGVTDTGFAQPEPREG